MWQLFTHFVKFYLSVIVHNPLSVDRECRQIVREKIQQKAFQ